MGDHRPWTVDLKKFLMSRVTFSKGASMDLKEIVERQPRPIPWTEGEKIPWNDSGFSKRMLKEHLWQDHDAASRRAATIDLHAGWVHRVLLSGNPTRILDLGCGPGLYTSRLARLGHECVGIDFSPASISYAAAQAHEEDLRCAYLLDDIRSADYGAGFGLVMLIYGEFNVFKPEDARLILSKVHRALDDGGILLLEAHTEAAVKKMGEEPRSWYSARTGLFSEGPHIMLHESFWDHDSATATERYFVIDASSGHVERHASTTQAYTNQQYEAVLASRGFAEVQFHESLTGEPERRQSAFMVITCRKG